LQELRVAKQKPALAKKSPQSLGEQDHSARPFRRRPWLLALSFVLVLAWILVLGYLAIFT
jgi:hypothetical protein